jgi:hypothetical protein
MKINVGKIFTVEKLFLCFHPGHIAIAGKADVEIFNPAVVRKIIAGTGRTVNGETYVVIPFYSKCTL